LRFYFLLGHFVLLQAKSSIFIDGQGIEKCSFLKNHSDFVAHSLQFGFIQSRNVFTVDQDFVGILLSAIDRALKCISRCAG